MAPTGVTFGLTPSYGIQHASVAHDWFVPMRRRHEEFEVQTDGVREPPMPFWSETVTRGQLGRQSKVKEIGVALIGGLRSDRWAAFPCRACASGRLHALHRRP